MVTVTHVLSVRFGCVPRAGAWLSLTRTIRPCYDLVDVRCRRPHRLPDEFLAALDT
ncbi:MAG: hypothetical protein J2P17_34675 [Mycobacterium sp.]|nr:hypothetical protein [Mycobacterium sp.]